MYCSNCGQPLVSDAQFCGSCGRAVNATARAVSAAAMLSSAAPVAAAVGAGAGVGIGAVPPERPASAAELPAQGLLARIRGILFSPKLEWPVIAQEGTTAFNILTLYALPLSAFAAVVAFVRVSLIGVSIPFGGTIRTPLYGGLLNAVLSLVMGVVGVCIVAAIINGLAPRFGGTKQWRQALKASAHSLTPAFVGSLFGLLPAMGTLLGFLAGIYGIYVLYLGLPAVMRSPRERAGAYTAWVVICTILLGIILGVVSAAVGIGSGRVFSAMTPAMSHEAQREQGAATVANVIGNALGTDEKGKAGLTTALSNLAKAGEQMEEARRKSAGSAGSTPAQAAAAPASTAGAPASNDPTQNALGAAGGMLSALGGALGGAHPKQPVDFHKLEEALPASLAGLPRMQIEGGSRQALGVKGVSAKATYGNGGTPRIQIEVSDMAGVAGLVDLASALPATDTSESNSGYEKEVTIGGRTAHEKFENSSKHGELSTLVAKRFSVDLTGDGLSMDALENALGQVNLSSLESMKDAGGQP